MDAYSLRSLAGSRHDQKRLGIAYKLALLLYVFTVVLFSYREGLTVFAKMAGLILAGLFLLRTVMQGERIFLPIEYKLLFAWFVVGVISSSLAKDPAATVARLLTLAQVFPLAFITSNILVWNGDSRFYWLTIVAAALLSGVITVTGGNEFVGLDGRLFGTLGNANAFASLLAAGVAICLAVAVMERRSVLIRAMAVLSAAFFLYLVGRTGSRMGMLACMVAGFAVAACSQFGRKGRVLPRLVGILVVGSVLVGGSLYYFSGAEFADRLAALTMAAKGGNFSNVGDSSLSNRALLFRRALEMGLDNPLLGVGVDVFRTASIDLSQIGNNSHSNYVEIFASTGLVGVIAYFSMYYFWWVKLVRAKGLLSDPYLRTRYATAVAIAALLLVLDVASVTYYGKLIWIVLAGLIAEASMLSRAAKIVRG